MSKEQPLLIGIDLGTSSVKCLVIDPEGQTHFSKGIEYSTDIPQIGWAEQDPGQWFGKALTLLTSAVQELGEQKRNIRAISFSGQMHGTVLIDRNGELLRPAIIWADQRSAAQVEHIEQRLTLEERKNMIGNPLASGFMLPSMLWLREFETELFPRVYKAFLPKDYLRYLFCGEIAAEPGDASSSAMFSPFAKSWSSGILESFALPESCMPQIKPSTALAGKIKAEIARQTGLPADVQIIMGSSDQACQALGNGIISEGQLSCTIGTGGQVISPTTRPEADEKLRLHLFNHALPDTWFYEGATLAAGLSVRWLRETIMPPGMNYQEISNTASQSAPGARGLFYLPHLVGERTPWMDAQARGMFYGLALAHERKHLARAVMEGVVFSLRQSLELIRQKGIDFKEVIASGGAVKHPLWLQLQADIFDLPVRRSQNDEAACLGAAMLAGVGCGVFADCQTAVKEIVRMDEEIVRSIPEHVELYEKSYQTYCQLYPAIQSIGK